MILLKGGLLIDPSSQLEEEKDILIDAGKIVEIVKPGSFDPKNAAQVVDVPKHWIVPGFVDLHVHLREPGFEWKETISTGAKAAVMGGITSLCCMPNTRPVNHNAEITRFILEQAKLCGLAHVRPIGSVSVSLEGKQLSPLSELHEAGCVAFSDDGEPVWDSAMMKRALEWCRMLGVRISCHEEDKRLSQCGCMNESALSLKLGLVGMPKVAEEVMIARDIELARSVQGKIHICHVSTARGVELIRRAKNDGIDITAEVTPHHLLLSEERLKDYDTNAKMSPPLREEQDLEALRKGLADGSIDAIASDHAPHEQDSKLVEFSKASFGILGLQTNLPLTLKLVRQGVLTRMRAIDAWTHSAARCFSLQAGTLRKGAVADISVINPNQVWNFDKASNVSKSVNSPFLGEEMIGRAEYVFVAGRMLVQQGELLV